MRCRHMAANHPNLAVPIPPGDLQNGQAASAWSLPKPAFLLPTPLRTLRTRPYHSSEETLGVVSRELSGSETASHWSANPHQRRSKWSIGPLPALSRANRGDCQSTSALKERRRIRCCCRHYRHPCSHLLGSANRPHPHLARAGGAFRPLVQAMAEGPHTL